jgi:hypothetical protein
MDYNNYSVLTNVKLESLINSIGVINQDIRISGEIKSLGKLTKINGHLDIDENLEDLGELNFIKTDLWCNSQTSLLKTLGKLNHIHYQSIQQFILPMRNRKSLL